MYRYQNNPLPINFANSFLRTDQSSQLQYILVLPDYPMYQAVELILGNSLHVNYQGPCFYNSIDADIRNVASISLLQSKLKTYLSSN